MIDANLTYKGRVESIIEEFCRELDFPREVVPTRMQISRAITSSISPVIEHISAYHGKPAQIVLYYDCGNGYAGYFESPNLESYLQKAPDFKTIPGVSHPEFGVLATVVALPGRDYDVLYFLR